MTNAEEGNAEGGDGDGAAATDSPALQVPSRREEIEAIQVECSPLCRSPS